MSSERKYVLVLVLVFAGVVGVQLLAPEPIDWSPSYSRHAASPYGSRAVFEVLDDLLAPSAVTPVDVSPYLLLRDTLRPATTYLFVTERFAPDEAEAGRLLAFAARGGTVFVAAHAFEGPLADTLRLETAQAPPGPDLFAADSLERVALVNPALREAGSHGMLPGTAGRFFARFDTSRATVLGTTAGARVNYVRLGWGEGAFLLHATPLAFTNFNLLEGGGAGYVAAAWSYLPARDVWWDEHEKPGRAQAQTPLRYVLSQPALRQAYLLGLITLLLFVGFRAKRRQRPIPVVAPLRNTTVAFTETVGRLYYQHGDHANLAARRIAYFLDYVRTRLRLPTQELDEAFATQVAARSGVPAGQVRALVALIGRVQAKPRLEEAELVRLSESIEAFYAASQA